MDYVSNILDVWHQTTPQQRDEGRKWYTEANKIAAEIGQGDTRKGAGILAALSPQKAWKTNVTLARKVASGDMSGHVRDALDKAAAIMDGEAPGNVLPEGKKTWHFFYNIWLPDAVDFVTIDRHAYRVATGEWDNGSPVIREKDYREIASGYIMAADLECEITCDMQAACWLWARMR